MSVEVQSRTATVEAKFDPVPGTRKPRPDQKVGLRVALTALMISLLWGANIVALKVSLWTFAPFWSAFWRMGLGALVIGLRGWHRKIRLRPEAGEWGSLLVLGGFCFIQITLLNHGVSMTSAAYAVVLINCHPIFTNLLAHYIMPGDRLSWARVIGLATAFAGICFIFLGKPDTHLAPEPFWGNLIATVSSFFVAVRSIATKRVVQRVDAVRAIFWTLVLSLPAFVAMALAIEPLTLIPLTWEPVAAVLYQGVVVAGFCFILWTGLLRDYPASIISMFAFPTPIFGVLFSALVFSETLAAPFLVGAAAVAAGILIAARGPTWRVVAQPREEEEPIKRAA